MWKELHKDDVCFAGRSRVMEDRKMRECISFRTVSSYPVQICTGRHQSRIDHPLFYRRGTLVDQFQVRYLQVALCLRLQRISTTLGTNRGEPSPVSLLQFISTHQVQVSTELELPHQHSHTLKLYVDNLRGCPVREHAAAVARTARI